MSERNVYAPPASEVSDIPEIIESGGEQPPFFPTSILKLVLMSVCSFGLYELYWFYQQWRYVKEREEQGIHPFWRAFFTYFFCYRLFKKVRDYDQPALALSNLPAGLLATGWIVVTLMWRLPDPFWLVSYVAVVFLIPVQLRVNHINRVVAPDHDPNTRFNWANWLTLLLGGTLFILSLIGTFIQDDGS